MVSATLNIKPEDLPAIVSSIASAVAVLISLWSLLISRQSLHISKDEQRRHLPNMTLYIQNGYVRRSPPRSSRIYAISISISNLSASDNSIVLLELLVTHRMKSGLSTSILLPHQEVLSTEVAPAVTLTTFHLPVNIPAHQAVAGWALFELPHSLVSETEIAAYLVQATDTHKAEYTSSPLVLTELTDEREAEKGLDNSS